MLHLVIPNNTDVNETCSIFEKAFLEIINIHAPHKVKRVKREIQPQWFTDEIRHTIYERDSLKSANRHNEYVFVRNKVISMIKLAKKIFFICN